MSAAGSSNPVIGVREVWKPKGEEPLVDIVAVHGLGGSAYGTWTAKTNRTGMDHDVFWLKDLLPKEVPHARILTYGYDSSPAKVLGSANTSMVHHHAMNLVSELHHFRRRDTERHRPIIFVCHSLGGIVVKRALIYSNGGTIDHNVEYRSIKVSTYGVVFLGTPHIGADLAKWGRWTEWLVASVAPKAVLDTNDALVKTLEKNSETLQNITEQFLGIAGDFRLFFFWETLPTPMGKGLAGQQVIVDYSSAVVEGLPNTGKYGIHATHSDMCKFADEESPGWNVLAGVLSDFVSLAPRVVDQSWRAEVDRQNQAKEHKIKNALLELPEYGRSRSPSPSRIRAHTRSPDLITGGQAPRLITASDQQQPEPMKTLGSPLVVRPLSLQENDYFEGRTSELKTIHKVLHDSSKRTICISSLSGGGKTHLARQYFFTHKTEYPGGAFWIDCKTIERTRSMGPLDYGFSIIAERLRLPARLGPVEGEDVQRAVFTQVNDWFAQNDGWLLVLDGLDIEDDNQLDAVSGYIPKNKGGSILITTQNSALRDAARLRFPELLELERMDFQSCTNMLFHYADIKSNAVIEREKSAAGDLIKELSFSPLMIHSAGSYIKARRMSIAEYVKKYKQRPFVEREFVPTLHFIFDRIESEERYHEAYNLLRVLSFFDREIPVEMVIRGIPSVSGIRFYARESGHILFDNTIRHLLTFSLVDRTRVNEDGQESDIGEIDTLMLHTVTQDVCRTRMREKDKKELSEIKEWLRHAIDMYCGSFDNLESKKREDEYLISDYRRFEVHGTRLIAHAQKYKIDTERLDAILMRIQEAVNADGNVTINRRSMFRHGSLSSLETPSSPNSTRTPSWNVFDQFNQSESPTEKQSTHEKGLAATQGIGHATANDLRSKEHIKAEVERLHSERPFQFRYSPPKGPRNPFRRQQRSSTAIEPSTPRAAPTAQVYANHADGFFDSGNVVAQGSDSPRTGTGALREVLQHQQPGRPSSSSSRMSTPNGRPLSRQSTFSSILGFQPFRPDLSRSAVPPGIPQQYTPRGAAMSPVVTYSPPPSVLQQRPPLLGRGRSGSLPPSAYHAHSQSAPAEYGSFYPFSNVSSPAHPRFDGQSPLSTMRSPPLQNLYPQPFAYASPPPIPMPPAPPYPDTPAVVAPDPFSIPVPPQQQGRPRPFSPGFVPDYGLSNSPTARSIIGPRERPPSEAWTEPIPEHGSFSPALSGIVPLANREYTTSSAVHRDSPPLRGARSRSGSRSGSRSVSPFIYERWPMSSSASPYPPPPLQPPPMFPVGPRHGMATPGFEDPARFEPSPGSPANMTSPPGININDQFVQPFASPPQSPPQPLTQEQVGLGVDFGSGHGGITHGGGGLLPPRGAHPLRRSSVPGMIPEHTGNGTDPSAEDMTRTQSEPVMQSGKPVVQASEIFRKDKAE